MSSETTAKKNIQKLQRVIVDGLEDVKGHDIQVFNTEGMSPLFERVIVASGTSNRQTKALAASVRDAVRDAGFDKPRMEGEDNGEWIIVDCGQAVVHVMQPGIRQYYRLEDIWGGKPVRMKHGEAKPRAATAASAPPAAPAAPARKPGAQKTGTPPAKAAGSRTAAQPARPAAGKKAATAASAAAGKPAARSAARPASSTRGRSAAAKPAAPVAVVKVGAPAKKAAAKKAPAKKAAPAKAVPAKAPARKAVPAKRKPAA